MGFWRDTHEAKVAKNDTFIGCLEDTADSGKKNGRWAIEKRVLDVLVTKQVSATDN